MPTVVSPTVEGREDRAEFMKAQANRYGFNLYLHKVKDFYTNRQYKISGKFINETNFEPKNLWSFSYCTFVAYIEALKVWLRDTNEDVVIVCDDDTDFSTSEYWNFTWQDFFARLPKNWQCTQLIRMRKNLDIHLADDWKEKQREEVLSLHNGSEEIYTLQYRFINRAMPSPNCGGGVFMLKREYVKKLINQYTKDDEYILDLVGLPPGTVSFPYPEMLMVSLGGFATYNFPMFVENINLNSTYFNCEMGGDSWIRVHVNSYDFYVNFWKENARLTTLDKLMSNKNINFS